jgi:hypothetical protein
MNSIILIHFIIVIPCALVGIKQHVNHRDTKARPEANVFKILCAHALPFFDLLGADNDTLPMPKKEFIDS